MSVVLRHMKFPFIILYLNPKDGWDEFVEEKILEEIRKDGFDKLTVIDEETVRNFLEFFKPVEGKKVTKKKKKKKKKKPKSEEHDEQRSTKNDL